MRILKISFLLVIWSVAGSLYAQSQPLLYAVLVANVEVDDYVGCGVQQDLSRVQSELKRIASIAGYRYQPVEITYGSKYKPESVLQAIQRAPQNTAVFVFYYSGHGLSGTEHLPCLRMGNNSNQWLYTQSVVAEIRKKTPRLAWIITDCCNDASRAFSNAIAITADPTALERENLKRLLAYKGEMVMTSCHYGQQSHVGPEGSYFTIHLFRALSRETRTNRETSWETIYNAAGTTTYEAVHQAKKETQHPYAQINIYE